MTDIRKRKKKLEDDLELLENDFEDRFSNAQKKVFGPLKPVEIIKDNPFKAIGTSVIVGVAIGLMGDNKSSSEDSTHRESHKEKLFELLFDEVKRVVARRAATYISQLIDERISRGK